MSLTTSRPAHSIWIGCAISLVAILVLAASAGFATEDTKGPSIFVDKTEGSGITCKLQNFATPAKHLIETMAGGVAAFDYDNDGYPDIFLTNGAEQPSLKKSDSRYFNRLYRNRGDWTFEDVTEKAGLKGHGYSFGVAAGDFDNDGNEDLFVTGMQGSTLYRNRGDGTFEDVTKKAGLAGSAWPISAAWFDYDNDGWLDLFVVDYVHWNPAQEPLCGDAGNEIRTYCHPRFYKPLANHLYHNNADGSFKDVSASSGIAALAGKGMGIAIGDYDQDGWPDVFITNDTLPNCLLHNNRNGNFSEVAMQAGVALDDDGKAISSMGADFRDLDNDGREDLIVTALANESFPYFHNAGNGLFIDMTYPSRIGAASLALSGWGVGSFDFNNDGWKDILVAAGDVQYDTESYSDRKSRQQNLLLINDQKGGFKAERFGVPALHRGVAFADFDRDGRVDAVITRLGETPILLRNVASETNGWLNVKLLGHSSTRDAIGARISVRAAGLLQTNRVTSSVGYASSSELSAHFGLGPCHKVDLLTIEWPSGKRQMLKDVAADRYITLTEP